MRGVTIEVTHDPARARYEISEDGTVIGRADYELRADIATFTHTFISPHRRGQGHAERLVRFALDDARERGLKVVPACWYVGQFLDDHPDYRDLLATSA